MRFIVSFAACLFASSVAVTAQPRFMDDFDGDLSGWVVEGEHAISIQESEDPTHGRVLELDADGNVQALVRGSEGWGAVRLEADILFPDDADNYLCVVYNYLASQTRTDFGCLYIKGNGSYIRANPWYDGNASRLLYEEYRTPLVDADAIRIGEWTKIKAEVMGRVCHLYVGDMAVPKVTFNLSHGASGLIGFQPRIVGAPVWIDDVSVTSIERLSYQGPDIPALEYDPSELLTDWQVLGPVEKPSRVIERTGALGDGPVAIEGERYAWRPFETDRRGAVVTARVTQYDGARSVAYFRTVVRSEAERDAILHISTLDEIALWVNGRFNGFVYRDGYIGGGNDWNAWHDFATNPDHAGRRVPLRLQRGENVLLFRVRNGNFASGGYFARVESK